jgi:uncharacterized protein YggE
MKHHIYLAVAALACGLPATPVSAQIIPPASITVSGEAHISVPPDLAEVDGGVSSEAKSAREASEANNAAMGKVLQALKAAGIAEKDVQTSRLANVVVGYRASNRVGIRVHDVSKLAGVIDTLVGAGANEIGGINFTVSEASKLLDDARTEAIADARRKAEIYAKAAGVTLGAPIDISEGGGMAPMPLRRMAVEMATPAPIAQGEDTLRVTVNVSWAIKPAQ